MTVTVWPAGRYREYADAQPLFRAYCNNRLQSPVRYSSPDAAPLPTSHFHHFAFTRFKPLTVEIVNDVVHFGPVNGAFMLTR